MTTRRLLEKHLTVGGYEVLSARNGVEAMRMMLTRGPGIVITDWMMPRMDGLELCRAIRSSEAIGLVYVIMLTSHTEQSRLVEAFEAGADDYLSKPFSRKVLLARLGAGERLIRLEDDLAKQNRAVHKTNADMAVLNRKLEEMATTDALTGLANRREAMTQLGQHWAAGQRSNQPLTCIMLDIDHFKQFNDTHGHDVGDLVLRETAAVLAGSTRAGEMACRLGGEEFLVICPNATAEMAVIAAERLRRQVESNHIEHNDLDLHVTVSAGVAQREESAHSIDDLLRAADEAMYAAKEAGRNRVCVAGSGQSVAPT